MSLPTSVKIYEVGPRDGLQNEAQAVSAPVRIELVNRLAAAGLHYIEAGAFVSPKWVPQMAETDRVFAGIERRKGVTYAALVPNEKGMENALESKGVDEIAVFTAASEEFCRNNINCSIEESLARFAPVIEQAKAHHITVRGYISCIAGCPYEGAVAPAKVADVAARLYEMGCYEISLGDTIGVGTPNVIEDVVGEARKHIPIAALALHCHDTYGQALANIYAGLRMGVATVDAAVAGLGGCPYAKGASGNVATEDVVYMLDGLGLESGADLDKLVAAGWYISDQLGRRPASKLAQVC